MDGIAEWKERCRSFVETPAGQRTVKGLSLVFTGGLAIYLAHQLGRIGLKEVLSSVPPAPWFYLLFAAIYFAPPLSESAIFRLLWNCPARRSLPALLKKRVYSKYLLDYSGEAYLYLWARQRCQLPERHLLHTIKDNAIISSTASTGVALLALFGLLCAGQLALPVGAARHGTVQVGAVVAVGGLVAALGIKFRDRILSLPGRTVATLFGAHAARLLLVMCLQVLLWTSAAPSVPLKSWLSLLSVEIVISRIPFLPNRDFVFVGVGLEMAGALDIAMPLLAGMLLTVSALEKLLNLCFFLLFSFAWPDRATREAGPDYPSARQWR